jgi:hypothetical protein
MNYCKNYRQNEHGIKHCGSSGSTGLVLADLYSDKKCTRFNRVAAVADCGNAASAILYAKEANEKTEG